MDLHTLQAAFEDELTKIAADLTSSARAHIKEKNFAIPEERKYPIEDKQHAESALGFSKMHGSSEEQSRVRAAVAKKYPGMQKKEALAGEAPSFARRFLEGASHEVGPALGALAGAGVGHALGASELASSGLGYGVGSLAQLGVEHALKKRKT
jgi:hypothetical protein